MCQFFKLKISIFSFLTLQGYSFRTPQDSIIKIGLENHQVQWINFDLKGHLKQVLFHKKKLYGFQIWKRTYGKKD